MIEAIIFDVGGVLASDINPHYERVLAEHLGKTPKFLTEPDKLYMDLQKGKINLKTFLKKQLVKEKIKMKKDEFEELFKLFNRIYPERILFDHDVLDYTKELGKDYKIVICSDTIKEHQKIWGERTRHFDHIFTSHELNMLKSDSKMFKHICKKIKVKPQNCIFVDDHRENVDAASKIGMKAILYMGFDALRKDLMLLGI